MYYQNSGIILLHNLWVGFALIDVTAWGKFSNGKSNYTCIVCFIFLLLIIQLLIFPSYSQTNVNNTNPLDQGNVSITEDRSPSLDNTSRISFVFKFKWGSFGTGNDQFRRPHDV